MNYLVIDVGGTFTKYALMNEECEFLDKGKIPTVQKPLDKFLQSLAEIYEKYAPQVSGIALSMPGFADSQNGFMYTGGFITSVSNVNIVEALQQYCPVPVTVGNDAKCAALAEIWRGSLQDCRNAVVMVIGTGVGGAVILDRKVLGGTHFMAGEFSYPIVSSEYPPKLENAFGFRSGVPGLIQYASEEMGMPKDKLDGKIIFDAANGGDERAVNAIRRYAGDLAVQISNYRFILDPERIAVGGGISTQPLLLKLIKEELKKVNDIYAQWNIPMPDVVNCKFFNDSNLIGALYLHLQLRGEQE